MTASEQALNSLKIAEHQFRLACSVHLAVTNEVQPLDAPVEWIFGRQRVGHEDFALRPDQAPIAAAALENVATFVLAAAIRDAICACVADPKNHEESRVVSSYQISRMLRNAFSHSMIWPRWSIDADCRNKLFTVDDFISLDTSDIHARSVHWRDYGGPIAMFRLGRFVREHLLKSPIDPQRRKPSAPEIRCYQQGRLVLRELK